MSGFRKCVVAATVGLLGVALAVSTAQATIIGYGLEGDFFTPPPEGQSRNGVDSTGERLNIDRNVTATLDAGTYQITDFSFFATSNIGSATPLLASLTSGNDEFTVLWIGDAVDLPDTSFTEVSADLAASFTLTGTTTVYAGFFTSDGGRVGHNNGGTSSDPLLYGVTAHNSSFTPPTTAGDVMTFGSFPTLARTYAFSLTVVPEPSTWAMLGVVLLPSLGLWFGWRKRGLSHVE